MKTFKFSILAKFLYRYSFLPIAAMMLFYIVVSAVNIPIDALNTLPMTINILLLYIIVRFYKKSYAQFPFIIEVLEDKMICSNFKYGKEGYEIIYSDIVKIEGGIFANKPTKPLVIHTKGKDEQISISPHIKGYNELLTIILSKINKSMYDELIEKVRVNKKLPTTNVRSATKKKSVRKKKK